MRKVFQFGEGIKVPDETFLYEMLGPRQQHSEGLPIIGGMSMAMGDLPPGISSDVHVHPVIAHFAFCLSGTLTVRMKDPASTEPYLLDMKPREAAYTAPGTFFQLINRSDAKVEVLYYCSPAFVFEQNEAGDVIYNDAHVLEGLTWEDLARMDWHVPALDDIEGIRRKREESLARLRGR